MDLKFACPGCGQHIVVDSSEQRRTMNCPGCNMEIGIPSLPTPQPPPSPVPRSLPAQPQVVPVYVNVPVQKSRSIGWGVFWGLVGFFIILPILGVVCLLVLGIGIPSFMEGRHRAQERAAARNNTNIVAEQTQVEKKVANGKSPTGERIEGAFGKKLGEVFHPAQARYTIKLTDDTPMYEFTPATSLRSFNRYYVLITPTTHKIYGIWAMGRDSNREAAQNEQEVVMELLREKYGEEEEKISFHTTENVKQITQGNRYIMTKIRGYTDATLEIRYYDKELMTLAKKERLASEINKTDKTGL